MASDPLKQRLLAAARSQPVPVRTEGAAQRLLAPLALLCAAAGAMCVPLWVAGGPAHAAGRPAESGAWVLGGVLLLAVAATWLSLPPARSMLPRPRGQLLAVMAGVPLLVGLWLVLGHPAYADPFERTGLRCLALTAATAPWPFAALARWSRRLDPVHPRLTGGALGAASGAWAAVMVELWCPLADLAHVALGHVVPLGLLVALGALAGGRLFGLRR